MEDPAPAGPRTTGQPRLSVFLQINTPPLTAGFLILLAFIGHAACAATMKPPAPPVAPPSYQPHYFFTIDLDSRYQFVGGGALTEEEGAQADCYCFTYGPDGKIERIEYRRAGVPAPDPLLQVTRIDFEYQPGTERRWYRDAQGQPVANQDGIYGEELTLNPAGFPTDVANLNKSGGHTRDAEGVAHYVRTLDDKGRLIKAQRIGLLGTAIRDDNGLFETRSAYDDQGRRVEYSNYDASGNLLDDNDGVAAIRTLYTLYPDTVQSIESYFDASGQAVEEKSTGVHQCVRTLDKRGLLLSEAYFDAAGSPTLNDTNGIHERRYEYDDRGNQLVEEFFGVDGKPKNHKTSGCARTVYHYDDKNRVSKKAFFGDDGTPQVVSDVGAAVIRQEYDDQGNLVRRQFFDGKGNPSPHPDYGAPAIRIKVEGDTTIVSLRNSEDKPIKNPVSGYASFSYKTNQDKPLTRANLYFDRDGRPMSLLRVFIINPHLHALRTTTVMRRSARYGAGATGLGALLAAFLALRKSLHTRRRKVYVPTPLERFLGWFSVLAIFEGTLRFVITIYWAWVGYQNGRMGPGVYVLETIFIVFFLYRLSRLRVTMRVLNIYREDVDRLIRDFFARAHLKPEWIEARKSFVTDALSVRINYSRQKYHAYLAFYHAQRRELARGLARYIRAQVDPIQGPPLSRIIAFYYPTVAVAYLLWALTAFYTLWQLLKGQS
jgi:YD repeat-containing protein